MERILFATRMTLSDNTGNKTHGNNQHSFSKCRIMKTNKLSLTLLLLLATTTSVFAGNKVDGAKIIILQTDNQEPYALDHTNENGEFTFFDIPPGNYQLTIQIPKSAITESIEDRKILKELLEGGCDKRQGRMVFKIKDACFVYDINCEDLKKSKFAPWFKISEEESEYIISIAKAEITETTIITGLFQKITASNFKKCLESGKFQLIPECN